MLAFLLLHFIFEVSCTWKQKVFSFLPGCGVSEEEGVELLPDLRGAFGEPKVRIRKLANVSLEKRHIFFCECLEHCKDKWIETLKTQL